MIESGQGSAERDASATDTEPDVSVIIVGRDARAYVEGCVRSLGEAVWRGVAFETIYVDNGSTDGTPEMLAAEFPEVRTIVNKENLGFCRAANQGARLARGRHLLFINDDTIVLDDAVPLLVEYLDEHPAVGSVGSRLIYPDGEEQWSGRRFPSPVNAVLGRRSLLSRLFPNARALDRYLYRSELRAGEPFPVDWVSAAGQAVRAETFRRVGGFAEDYYYWHEAIICDRIRRAGYEVHLHPCSRIVHYEGKGSGARPYKIRKWHIVNFHQGAYRAYCEHYDLGRLNPLRYFAAALLGTRAALLMFANRVATLGE